MSADGSVTFATSGTTGDAKTVVRGEQALRADAAALVAAFPEIWRARPYVVATVRADHMYGALWRVRAPACAGTAVHPSTVFSVEELVAVRAAHPDLLLVTTPSFLERALEHPDFARLRDGVRGLVTSGAPLRPETSRAIGRLLGVPPLEIYGSTEAGTVAWRRSGDAPWRLMEGVGGCADASGCLVVDSPFACVRPWTMSDRVSFADARTFRLLGRADRRVKILERFVSLDAVETAFCGHWAIARARCVPLGGAVPRLGLVVELTERGTAALAAGTYAALCSALRRDLREKIGDLAFPRRLRFVRALPANEQGKTTVASLRRILTSFDVEPAVLAWKVASASLTARLAFPPDHPCFKGHFPGFPILPGVAQLFFVRHFARQVFRDYPEAAVFRKLKFRSVIFPGEAVDLSIVRSAEGTFDFSITCPKGVCVSATVVGLGLG